MQRRTLAILTAFALVYVIWGSTYLAIRFAVDAMPPFLMASARWLIAGALLYAWRRIGGVSIRLHPRPFGLRWRRIGGVSIRPRPRPFGLRRTAGDPAPTARQWLSASIIGVALILGGNGLVSWAEQWVPSSLTALLIAVVPLWIAMLIWARMGEKPTIRVAAGILLGLAGVAVLFAPSIRAAVGGTNAILLGSAAIMVATLSWAAGSIYSRTARLPVSTLLGVSMQMLAGGIALAIVGLATGEWARVDLAAVDARAWISFGFLVIFGSIIAFSAYIWLLKQVPAALVATYAFVNPIVAVILGIVLGGEEFGRNTLVASALIVVGVALVVTAAAKRRGPRREAAQPPVAERDAS